MYKPESKLFESKAAVNGSLIKIDESTESSHSQKFYKIC